MNDTIKSIATIMKDLDGILIFPHINMDGDALGSATALCLALRELGKKSYVMINEPVPKNLDFLECGCTTDDDSVLDDVQLSIMVDCNGMNRIPGREAAWERGRLKGCIDHHQTKAKDIRYDFSRIEPKSAATGEIIFDLLVELGVDIDQEMAESLFAAITTDTGNFQYSNTTAHTHEIVIALYDCGLNSNKVSVALYENESFAKMQLHSKLIESAQMFADGEGVLAVCTQKMLKETGTLMEDTEGVVSSLRSIHGVQVAAFIKEQPDGSVKVSLRSKERGDVAAISQRHGGGGHVRAAGFNLEGVSLEETVALVIDEVTACL